MRPFEGSLHRNVYGVSVQDGVRREGGRIKNVSSLITGRDEEGRALQSLVRRCRDLDTSEVRHQPCHPQKWQGDRAGYGSGTCGTSPFLCRAAGGIRP